MTATVDELLHITNLISFELFPATDAAMIGIQTFRTVINAICLAMRFGGGRV